MSLINAKQYHFNWALWIGLMLLSLVLLSLNGISKEFNVSMADSIKSKAVGVRTFFSYGISAYFMDLSNKSQIIDDLRAENTDLKRQLANTNRLELENKYLQNKLNALNASVNFVDAKNLNNIITTGIVVNSLGTIGNNLTIGIGSNQGVAANQLVITNKGIVGYTTEVEKNSANILSVLDSNFRISAITNKTNVNIVISGNKTTNLDVTLYSQGIQIQEGEIAYTSGLEGNFPKFIAIGVVVKAPSADGRDNWKIKLFEDLSNLNYVYVVR
ncbi:MAG: rod shape-determining protein MreC [Alphaproteobacteria bacterium]|jgi:rod shape-determining protein MreC|nr:rod shape-determining protein MreC [Alphaproteobacteria bacterium]